MTDELDLREWAIAETTWDPSQATSDSDGYPDERMVPYVEGLLKHGVKTYQSCVGHDLDGGVTRNGGVWFRSPIHQFNPHVAADCEEIDQVARVYGREEFPIWTVSFKGMADGKESFESSMDAIWDALGIETTPPHK